MRLTLASLALPCGLALAGLAGCYGVDFDPAADGVYYCQSDADCGETQACSQFACVDDSGPQVSIGAPEALQREAFGSATLSVNYSATNFTISDFDGVVEGQGKMLVKVLGTEVEQLAITENGTNLDISALAPGPYRLSVQAVRGDGTPYENPGATLVRPFYLEDQNPVRPQTAIVTPYEGYVHVVGEPLEVTVAAHSFEFVGNGDNCRVDDGCDPWAEDATCMPVDCDFTAPTGHAHVYNLADFPDCLNDEVSCNGAYIASLRPSDNVESDGVTATGTISGDVFSEPGTITFSIGLQYNDHTPYPNKDFIIIDQFTIEVVER